MIGQQILLKKHEEIKGKGNSLWGKSDGLYVVTHMEFESEDGDIINVYGENLEWFHYTDTGIEKAVQKIFAPLIEKHTGKEVAFIGWSEQGMQQDGCWNFDVGYVERHSYGN